MGEIVRASELLKLLDVKHNKDVFIPECKTGPTHYADSCPRLDAWAMKRSWANFRTYGYEIKISRQDFLGDDKWRQYLDFCTDFYFVAPQGLIDPNELPPEAGLIVASKNLVRLFTKKKAPSRDVALDPYLCQYILQSRVSIRDEYVDRSKKIYWQNWLKRKKIDREFGWNVSKKLQETIENEIEKVKDKNREIRAESERLKPVKKLLIELGIDTNHLYSYRLKEEIQAAEKRIRTAIPTDLIPSIGRLENEFKRFKRILSEIGGDSGA